MSDPFRLLTNKINPEVRKIIVSIYAMTRNHHAAKSQWCGRGWDYPDRSVEHGTGRAVDWMISDKVGKRPTPEQYRGAMDLVNWVIANGKKLHLQWALFSVDGVVTWSYNMDRGSWNKLGNRGSISANHIDHIHFYFKKSVKYPADINWVLPNSFKSNEKEITMSDINEKDAEKIAKAILSYKITANGKTMEFAQHLADLFVYNYAQSVAVGTEAARDKALHAQLDSRISDLSAAINELSKKIG